MSCDSVAAYSPSMQVSCRRISKNLVALGELFNELTHCLTSSPPSQGVIERVRERGSPGIPLNTRAVDIRDEICGVLASWAAVVCEGQRVQAPARDAIALLAFLTHHAGWLAGHQAAGDLVTETEELVKAAWSVLSGSTDRHMVVGPCVRSGCRGTLVVHLGSATPSGRTAITCSAERGHTWSPELWHTLQEVPARPGRSDAGLTVQDISTGWRISSGTVYWLANSHQWRRRKNGLRVFYHRDDVLATMRARSAAGPGSECAAPGA